MTHPKKTYPKKGTVRRASDTADAKTTPERHQRHGKWHDGAAPRPAFGTPFSRERNREQVRLPPQNTAKRRSVPQEIDRKELSRLVAEAGFSLDAATMEGVAVYLESLTRWNAVMNLVGRLRWQDILRLLAMDSFHLARFLDDLPLRDAPLSYDLGAGAGLPGMLLRLVWRGGTYWMVEAREKRAAFMLDVLGKLDVGDTHVHHGRAEDFLAANTYADCIIARAFLPWPRLLEAVCTHVNVGGHVVVMAGTPPPTELPGCWRCLHGREYASPSGKRWLWALDREAHT